MERRCALQQRARSSFGKVHAGEAPPHLQVIGFNVCSPPKSAETEAKRLELARGDSRTEAPPPPAPPKPASSPRSALQQLLLTQPAQMLPRATSPSLPPCPPAAKPSPSINQNVPSEIPSVNSPPSPHQIDPNCGILKSLLLSGKANADDPANQSFISTDRCKFLDQSQLVSTPSPKNRVAGRVRLNVHDVTNEDSTPKSSRASIKENYAASMANDEIGYTDKQVVCVERPDLKAKGNNSGWLQDDDEEPSSDENFTDGGRKTGPEVSKSSLRNEKSKNSSSWIEESTSKKSSLFMFVVSSPVPEVGRHLHHGEYDACEDTDFLSSCHLCRRHLIGNGKDVFMYRGDKSFCSTECRYQQIVADERRERCPPPIIRSGASQVYQHPYISTTSPTATSHHAVAIDQPHFINTAMAA